MEVRCSFDSVMTPRPYWKCLIYCPFGRAFIRASFFQPANLLRLCFLFLAPVAPVPCPALYRLFPAVNLQLFLNAISLQVFVHRGDGPFRLRPAWRFFRRGLGHERTKMERVPEVLQFPVIIKRRRALPVEPQLL